VQSEDLSICRLNGDEGIPDWCTSSVFLSVSKTIDELSIVCESHLVPLGVKAESGWRALKVLGPLDFSMTGVMSSIATPLANEGISIFAISTFDTDYILVKFELLDSAIKCLRKGGLSLS
jgi:hypothetical protein